MREFPKHKKVQKLNLPALDAQLITFLMLPEAEWSHRIYKPGVCASVQGFSSVLTTFNGTF